MSFWACIVSCCLFLFTACSTDDDDSPVVPVSYTVLVYMAADNSMDSEVDYTLQELKEGMKRSGGTTVVYLDRAEESPRLFRITTEGEEIALKDYAEENSASAATLARVINDTKELAPSDKFGLVYWSHSMGWVPSGYSKDTRAATVAPSFPRTRYLGMDEHQAADAQGLTLMEIDEMAAALPDHVAEFMLFDACMMGSVEALYQLRNKCSYFIASPAEILMEADYDASGMPYSDLLPQLFGGKEELAQACQKYYNHYNGMSAKILRSATITLIDAQQLDGLYAVVDDILNNRLSVMQTLSTDGLQVYHRASLPRVFFDLDDVMKQVSTAAQYQAFETQLAQTVLYKAATAKFAGDLVLERCSGLSVYVPLSKWKDNWEYTYYFSSLEWSKVYGTD
ncbi:clostripain-related cysteine peptidase [uncultured Bacteroides sp.]|uniref:clostripain-related cysteine peptidase n=1 Tax=uncultured Bacteroides sp. TaxID=162156 RepID=UPI002AA8748E|nr:clostripain-related cysteine peptidase [uncultured Bacteroides sp.]